MRIILGLESYLPNISGVVIFTKRLATHLAEAGYEVWIFTTGSDGAPAEEKDRAGFYIYPRIENGVGVYRFSGWRNPFRKDLSVSHLRNREEINRLLEKLKPDLIHLQDPGVLSGLLLKEANQRKIPVIFHHHFSHEFVLGYFRKLKILHPLIRSFVQYRARGLYNRSRLVITPTEFVKHTLENWGIKVPIIAISNGIELDRFKPAKFNPEEKVVLYVGRLDKDKNIQTLIRAIPKVLEKLDAKFIFVGGGSDQKNLEEYVRRQPWSGKVEFSGPVPYEQVSKIYQSADLYWIASTIETQSLTTLEAMASGLPIVAANFGALPEIVHDGKNGFLIEPYNIEGFANAVSKILSDKELANRFGEKSLEIASHHDIKASFKKIEEVYAQYSLRG